MGYVCIHCNTPASSKCVNQRSIFPENQMGAILTHILKGKITHTDVPAGVCSAAHRRTDVEITWRAAPNTNEDGTPFKDMELFWNMIQEIRNLPEDALKYWACDHEYKWVGKGTCDFGCCSEKKN
jgi:hypothetical protein